MSSLSWLQLVLYLAVLLGFVKPLGAFMARVYSGERTFLGPVLGPVERLLYRVAGVNPDDEMGGRPMRWRCWSFNLLGLLVVYALQRLQGILPLNPQRFGAVAPDSAFNTRGQFRHQHQLAGLRRRDDDELSDADARVDGAELRLGGHGHGGAGRAVRGIARHSAQTIGNFWVDLTRSTLYILLPLSLVLALVLVSQGVVQTFSPYQTWRCCNRRPMQTGKAVTQQLLAIGPAASQIAIKQLGTNGGGFFNVNSAHPFENPTPLSNFLEMLAILLIPAALCYTFGKMVGDTRQGWADPGGDDDHLRADRWAGASGPSSTATLPSRRWAWIRRPAACSPAATWKARRCASASPTRRCGPRPPPPPPTARSTRCTTPSCRWAGWPRCG